MLILCHFIYDTWAFTDIGVREGWFRTSAMWIPKDVCIKLCHLNIVKVLLFLFLTWVSFLFYFPIWLLSLPILLICCIKSGESGHPCLVPDLIKNNFNRFKIECAISWEFTYGIYYVEIFPFVSSWLRAFIISGCYILSNDFSFTELIRFLSFILLKWFITLIDLWILVELLLYVWN